MSRSLLGDDLVSQRSAGELLQQSLVLYIKCFSTFIAIAGAYKAFN